MTISLNKLISIAIVLLGCLLSFVSSFHDQYAEGYYIDFGVVMAGLVPYLIFGMAMYLREGVVTTMIGLVLLAVHLWMVYQQHFVIPGGSDGLLLFGPPVLGILLLPLLIVAMRKGYAEAMYNEQGM
jgi:uncharacterized membrane protein